MWETQFGEGREKWGARKFITFQQATTLPGVLRVACYFFSCLTRINLQRFTTKAVFVKNICQFFSLNNHSAHQRWLPGTPPPPIHCWALVPPMLLAIGRLWQLPCFYWLTFTVCQRRWFDYFLENSRSDWTGRKSWKSKLPYFLRIKFYKNKNKTF